MSTHIPSLSAFIGHFFGGEGAGAGEGDGGCGFGDGRGGDGCGFGDGCGDGGDGRDGGGDGVGVGFSNAIRRQSGHGKREKSGAWSTSRMSKTVATAYLPMLLQRSA